MKRIWGCTGCTRTQFWTTTRIDSVTILRFDPGSIRFGVDLRRIGVLWQLFENLYTSPDRILLIDTRRDELSPDTLNRLLKYFKEISEGDSWSSASDHRMRVELAREDNAFQRYIGCVRDSRLFVLCACQGEIDLNLLGLVLACDYRIASADTVIVNRGSPLDGRIGTAAPWFLAQLIGRSRSLRILLNQTTLTARPAFRLGLFHQLTRAESHLHDALAITRGLAARGVRHLLSIKRALNEASASLESYWSACGAGFEGLRIGSPHCANCEYDLKGNATGRCPECGTPTELPPFQQAS